MFITPEKQDRYYENLKIINNILFTSRQVDVISCIANARVRHKQIADILGIEVTVVRSHINLIKERMKQSSVLERDVVSFVEKSSNYQGIKRHYNSLLYLHEFEKALKESSKKILGSLEQKISVYSFNEKESSFLTGNTNKKGIVYHLQLLGIKTHPHKDATDAQINFDSNKKIFILSNKCVSKLLNCNQNIINSSNSILLLIGSRENSKKIIKLFPNAKVICFSESYYSSFFDVIKTIEPSLEEIMQSGEFKFGEEINFSTNSTISYRPQTSRSNLTINKFDLLLTRKAVSVLLICFLSSACFIWLFNNYKHDIPANIKKSQTQYKEGNFSWNLPASIEHFVDRPGLVKAVWDKLQKLRNKNTDIALIGLYGLGGTGKTTLASWIINHPKKDYSFKGMFNSETKALLQNNYFELGLKFNLFYKDMSDKQKIDAVKEWLEKQDNILLVYDNVPDMNILKEYLPRKGDILITSRNYNLPGAIEIDVMNEKEAFELIDNLVANITIEPERNYNQYVKKLAETMGYLPLALSQAGSYISQNIISIPEYLTLYNNHRDKLLSLKTAPSMEYHIPVYVTWDVSIKQLKQDPHSGDSIRLLEYISICSSEYIPKRLLALYLYGSMDSEAVIKINKHLSLLRNYSLIKLTNDSVSVHRLVHAWIRDKQLEKEKLLLLKRGADVIENINSLRKKGLDIGFVKASLPHIEETIHLLQSNVEDNKYADLLSILGDLYFDFNDHSKGIKVLEQALKIKENSFPRDQKKISYILNQLGTMYLAIGNYDKSIGSLTKALEIDKKYSGSNSIEVAKTLFHIGNTYRSLGNYNKSLEFLQSALQIEERTLGKENLKIARTLRSLGATHNAIGNFKISLELLERSLEIEEKNLGVDHLNSAYTLHQLGRTHHSLGNHEKSIEILNKSLAIQRKHFDKDNAEIGSTLRQLGRTYRSLGDYKNSIKLLEEALAIEIRYFGPDHLYCAYTMHQLGITYRYLGNYRKSVELSEKALDTEEKIVGKDNIRVAYILHNLGKTYLAMGNYKKGLELLERTLKIEKYNLGDQNIRCARTLEQIAIAHKLLGNDAESARMSAKAKAIMALHDLTNSNMK